MWQLHDTIEGGMVLEWRPPAADRVAHPHTTLTAREELSGVQWLLIRKQFENMGIRPVRS
jgi:hypothetical protein